MQWTLDGIVRNIEKLAHNGYGQQAERPLLHSLPATKEVVFYRQSHRQIQNSENKWRLPIEAPF